MSLKEVLELEENGSLLDLRDNALIRIQNKNDKELWRRDSVTRRGLEYTKEAWIFRKGEEAAYFTRDSPILRFPELTIQTYEKQRSNVPLDQDYELRDGIWIPYNQGRIPTNRFDEEEITSFAFRDLAETYGQLLMERGVENIAMSFPKKYQVDEAIAISKEDITAAQNFFRAISGWSGFQGGFSTYPFNCVGGGP